MEIKERYICKKKREYEESKRSGAGKNDVREPNWPWFKYLRFLDNFNADNELVGLLVFIFYFVTFILCE